MKEIVKTSRLAGQLEKIFRMLNNDFFDGVLDMPVITIQSTPRAYGHYSVVPIWTINGEELKHEINVGAGTLDRDIDYTVATLLHEMCHMWNDTVRNISDVSRGSTYHNKFFREAAETHGLKCSRSEKYGWSRTEPSNDLIEWILNNNIQEIKMNRQEPFGVCVVGGSNAGSKTAISVGGTSPSNHSRKYTCPCCGNSVRATKQVNVICGDCLEKMI